MLLRQGPQAQCFADREKESGDADAHEKSNRWHVPTCSLCLTKALVLVCARQSGKLMKEVVYIRNISAAVPRCRLDSVHMPLPTAQEDGTLDSFGGYLDPHRVYLELKNHAVGQNTPSLRASVLRSALAVGAIC